jgi:hypothetical protein
VRDLIGCEGKGKLPREGITMYVNYLRFYGTRVYFGNLSFRFCPRFIHSIQIYVMD